MKKTKLLLFIFPLIFSSCDYGIDEFLYRNHSVLSRTKKLDLISNEKLDNENEKTEYTVLIFTDSHFNEDDGFSSYEKQYEPLLEKITALSKDENTKPRFAINLGDSTEHGYKSEYEAYNNFLNKKIQNLDIPVFNLPGNHDLYNSGWDNYKSICYPYSSFYKIKTQKLSWYFIDSASGSIGNNQFEELENDFQNDKNPKIISMHIPVYAENFFYFVLQNTEERNLLLSLFAQNNVSLILAGHTHDEIHSDLGLFTEECIPGLHEKNGWSILTVNENTKSFKVNTFYLK